MKKNKAIGVVVVIALFLGLLTYTTAVGFGPTGTGAAKNITLGLDLSGGVSITYEVVVPPQNHLGGIPMLADKGTDQLPILMGNIFKAEHLSLTDWSTACNRRLFSLTAVYVSPVPKYRPFR